MTSSFRQIPTIDVTPWRIGNESQRSALADEVLRVCHEVGFFTVVGHGVPDEFMNRYFDSLAAFFALPTATKETIDKHRSPHFRGWERVGSELTDNRVDYREQLDVSTENPVRAHTEPQYLCLDGPNQWLAEETLPGFRALVNEFMARSRDLADDLMAMLSRAFGLGDDYLRRCFGQYPHSLAKLISYPRTPPGEAGVNAHHDAGFLTVLAQHDIGGLQALNPDGEWIDVVPQRGSFVINLGEMLQEMSGNYVVATTHRVIAHEPRLSTAYFHGPDLSTPLDRLPLGQSFVDSVAASPRHATAGFMAKRDELLTGASGTSSSGAGVYGQQLWNYYLRSYPDNVATHYPQAQSPLA